VIQQPRKSGMERRSAAGREEAPMLHIQQAATVAILGSHPPSHPPAAALPAVPPALGAPLPRTLSRPGSPPPPPRWLLRTHAPAHETFGQRGCAARRRCCRQAHPRAEPTARRRRRPRRCQSCCRRRARCCLATPQTTRPGGALQDLRRADTVREQSGQGGQAGLRGQTSFSLAPAPPSPPPPPLPPSSMNDSSSFVSGTAPLPSMPCSSPCCRTSLHWHCWH
jgi:hypothetical protein